ncbi:MAG: DUF2283 domain-containing protein [archaeon]
MKKFNFNYDLESDDLFVYLEGKKSSGAVELGNFVLDFDSKGDLVAIQILNISDILNRFFSKIKEASKINEVRTEIINFRNIEGIKFKIIADGQEETANFLIPHIKEKSPVLTH